MKTIALIERGKDGSFGIYAPNIECATWGGNGSTIDEAKADFLAAYNELLEYYKETPSDPMPDELKDLEFEYKYDTASALAEFSFINLSAFSKIVGINPTLMHRYKTGEYISHEQARRIQDGINNLGRKMAAFSMV